jgi:AraC-like DNA-binding protein
MMSATSLEGYRAQPMGRYVCGPTYAVWWRSTCLNGIMFWGRPDEADIHRVALAIDAESADAVSHMSLIDARRLESIDPTAFNALAGYVEARHVEYARLVAKQAVLRPKGFAGAAVAGFYAVIAASYPTRVFVEPSAALEWLGTKDEMPVIDELDGIHAEAMAVCPLIHDLRAYLASHLGAATLNVAAARLGVSQRNLQRRLREAYTTFQAELNGAQIRAAKGLLLETNYDLKRIAIEVGCGSQAHFSTLFRRLTGSAPSQWRAHHGTLNPPIERAPAHD